MQKRQQPPRERAARALCKLHGHPADARLDGKPMWESCLDEVDVVLAAALAPTTLAALLKED